jgi:adenosylcobinamide kinase/adenosylcobinamide-phosphate guanylyltransferase
LASKGIGKKAPRAFVATGEGLDEEMAIKIARHRQSRSSDWITAEVPLELTAWLKEQGQDFRTILIDCLTMWLSNRWREGSKEEEILQDARTFLTALRRLKARTVMVSNELGMGLVPIEADSRRFREVAGALNRLVAQEADEAYFVVSGISLRLK